MGKRQDANGSVFGGMLPERQINKRRLKGGG